MDGRLGEGAEVPRRSGVVTAQGFAAVQPGKGSMQQRRAAHLAPCEKGQERDRLVRAAPTPSDHLRILRFTPASPSGKFQAQTGPGRRSTASNLGSALSTLASTHFTPLSHTNIPSNPTE